ncbi:hypothetical protein [Saccharospirillum alexandrii]|uniref:hypothetical protein n=1 Tax=Saccharospirillum alexandrii TaxID=2448477 RepID=UPI003735AAC3
MSNSSFEALQQRLSFLGRVVRKEIQHLNYSEQRAFAKPITIDKVRSMATDEAFAERVEAYTSRFCRLQDTVGDRLLPSWLTALGEQPRAAIDNLDKAERLGVLESADQWLMIRQLRNQMMHEYIEVPEILANALEAAHSYQPTLINCANAILTDLEKRELLEK